MALELLPRIDGHKLECMVWKTTAAKNNNTSDLHLELEYPFAVMAQMTIDLDRID